MTKPLERIAKLEPYVPGLSIAEIRERYNLNQIIKLASNENPLGTSPLVQETIQKNAADVFRYPQGGNPGLCREIARTHGRNPDEVVVGNGSDEIIDLLIRIFCDGARHNIVCFRPCFSIYPIQATINGNSVRQAPLEDDFSFDFDKLLQLVDQNTRLVFITTPDNPSGYCPGREEVADFAERLKKIAPEALLIIDEAYMDFHDNEAAQSLLYLKNRPENIIFIRTFSKSYGLAGLRLGYALLPKKLAKFFWATRLPFSVNVLAEKAAITAMNDSAFRQATLNTVKQGREYLTDALLRLGCHVWPSSANFLMFKPPVNAISAKEIQQKLLERGIIIRSLASYGLPENLRVSVGNEHENRLFIQNLEEIVKG